MGRRRVLVVDDEADLCALLDVYLAQHGIEVVGVGTVAAAIGELERIDLLLTDLNLPDGDGIGLAEQARGLRSDLPVVVMSGFVDSPQCTRAAVHLLPKPFGMQQLAAMILSLVGERSVSV